MIQPEDKTTIIKYLGKQYSRNILPELNRLKLVNQNGKPFSTRSVNGIINAETENLPVEKAIFRLVKKVKKNRENLTNFKQSI